MNRLKIPAPSLPLRVPADRTAPRRAAPQPPRSSRAPAGGAAGRGGGRAPGAARGAEPPPRSAPFRGHARLLRTCSLRPQRARTLRSAAAPRCASGEYGQGGTAAERLLPAPAEGPGGSGGPARGFVRPRLPGEAWMRGAGRGARGRVVARSEALAPKPVGGARWAALPRARSGSGRSAAPAVAWSAAARWGPACGSATKN